ncbi:DNA mismatch repair protein msh6 [Peziza echinospora]|nr:DNA mismatch repair protein msh6 [Peziza echinospora]
MAKGDNPNRTPASASRKPTREPPSTVKQRSLLSFFTKGPAAVTPKKEVKEEDEKENKRENEATPSGKDEIEEDEVDLPPPSTKGKAINFLNLPSSPGTVGAFSSDAVNGDETPSNAFRKRGRLQRAPVEPSSPIAARDAAAFGGGRSAKRVTYAESSDEEVNVPSRTTSSRQAKRARRAVESEDEFTAIAEVDIDEEMEDFIVPDEEDSDAPVSKSKKKKSTSSTPTPKPISSSTAKFAFRAKEEGASSYSRTPSKAVGASTPTAKSTPIPPKGGKEGKETRYPWLADPKDADGNPPNHPDYDPRTLYIPPSAWAKFTPFEKQYWEIKCKNWDTVVFFRKGKFFELFENDATIGNQEFDLKITSRVNMSMVGMPEYAFDMWAAQFIAKGYKVARVDQKESAIGKEMREKENASATKEIIKRELGCILTGGTLVDENMLQDEMSLYCVSIKESIDSDDCPSFGIAFVDTATGAFQMTEFKDDLDYTKFETFVAQIRPRELILEKNEISTKAIRILKNNTALSTIWNKLKPGKEFWDARTTVRELISGEYFSQEDPENMDNWPTILKESEEKELVMSALGGLISYLQHLQIDKDIVSMANFTWYDPIRKATSLVLDGQTLKNLEIFSNSFDGDTTGTLFSMLNRCITPFGKRMFRQWLCHPLADINKINARLDAVDILLAHESFRETFVYQLGKLPDLERLISRIHAGGVKPQDFVRVLEGFEQIRDAMTELSANGPQDSLIGQLVNSLPDLDEKLRPWETAFDRSKAKVEGVLVPERGFEEDFDNSQDTVESIINELQEYMTSYQKEYKSKEICFRDIGKDIYLIEVPTKIKNVPKNWTQMFGTQKVKRYYSPEIKKLVRTLREAQETHSQIVKEVRSRFCVRFDQDYAVWLQTCKIVAQLDCLISLSKASASLGEPRCRPKFIEGENERSVLNFEELRHPCMLPSSGDFIPNDINLGGETPKIALLTGANAAGKSTVLRMTCVAVILAQIGCYVPAASATLTPVDRIMSRLGANDNIFASQSTFFVELSETKKILSEATPRSLVILDELGRGTSSYDGVAVAQSVLHHIATHIGCIGFFATHYHSLAAEFSGYHPEIVCKRMAIDVDEAERRITFLYKLEEGVAEGSFGMHCAAMCGIKKEIIDRAEEAARMFEHTSRLKERLEQHREEAYVPLGMQSDFAWLVSEKDRAGGEDERRFTEESMLVMLKAIEAL